MREHKSISQLICTNSVITEGIIPIDNTREFVAIPIHNTREFVAIPIHNTRAFVTKPLERQKWIQLINRS